MGAILRACSAPKNLTRLCAELVDCMLEFGELACTFDYGMMYLWDPFEWHADIASLSSAMIGLKGPQALWLIVAAAKELLRDFDNSLMSVLTVRWLW